MAYLDPEKKRKAERDYRRRNGDARRAYEKRARQEMKDFKQNLLSVFPCIACGESDPDIIDWHHVDPSQKKHTISVWALSHNAWWNEVLKCVPLCCNCHRKIHKDKLCLLPIRL